MLKPVIRGFFIHFGPLFIIRKLSIFFHGPSITILYGHRVLEDYIIANKNDFRSFSCQSSVSDIRAAIKSLTPNYHFISMDEAVHQINTNTVKPNGLVLTFDDGFQDNITNLLPILKEFNVPAVFYISSSVIGTDVSLWFQSVINYFSSIKDNTFNCELTKKSYDLSTPEKKLQSAFQFMKYLQNHYPPEKFHKVIQDIAGEKSLPHKEDYHLNWEDLEKLKKEDLITIGAHGVHHYPLNLCSAELAKTEISNAISHLEKKLNITIKHFSYPRGHKDDFNSEHISQIKKSGMISAVTTIQGINNANQDIFQLKRIGLPCNITENTTEFIWNVAAIPQVIQRIKNAISRKNINSPVD